MMKWLLALVVTLLLGLSLPHPQRMPVEGADRRSYDPETFWYHPWGRSGTHKGVDVFARKGTPVSAATGGVVLYSGHLVLGGNVVLMLGPKWRLHYYAHLEEVHTRWFQHVSGGTSIGTVGDTGNAKGKPPHLHYSIMTLIPYPWQIDSAPQGWKKMFYLDPTLHIIPKRK